MERICGLHLQEVRRVQRSPVIRGLRPLMHDSQRGLHIYMMIEGKTLLLSMAHQYFVKMGGVGAASSIVAVPDIKRRALRPLQQVTSVLNG